MASSFGPSSASARERTPLPEGTIPVGVALLIAGVATYAFFKVGNLALGGDEEFEPITSLWFATFALAPGFFLPLKQELGRALDRPVGVVDDEADERRTLADLLRDALRLEERRRRRTGERRAHQVVAGGRTDGELDLRVAGRASSMT